MIAGAVIRGLLEPWTNPDETAGVIVAGGSVASVGLAVGLSLVFVGDEVHFGFHPSG